MMSVMSERFWVDAALDDVDACTPTAGYNVVAVDSFDTESPLRVVSTHATEPEAAAAAAEHTARTGEPAHVYGPRSRP